MTYRNQEVPIMQTELISDYDLIAVDGEKIRIMAEIIRNSIYQDKSK